VRTFNGALLQEPSALQTGAGGPCRVFTPSRPDWAREIAALWRPGERGARQRLDAFLESAVKHYEEGRDRPDRDRTKQA